jgi:hypothetical protein
LIQRLVPPHCEEGLRLRSININNFKPIPLEQLRITAVAAAAALSALTDDLAMNFYAQVSSVEKEVVRRTAEALRDTVKWGKKVVQEQVLERWVREAGGNRRADTDPSI